MKTTIAILTASALVTALAVAGDRRLPGPTACGSCGADQVFGPLAGSGVSLPLTNMVADRASLDSTDLEIALGTTCKKNNAHPSGSDDSNTSAWETAAPTVDMANPNTPAKKKKQIYVRRDSPNLDTVMASVPLVGSSTPEGVSDMPRVSGDGEWLIFNSTSTRLTSADSLESPNFQDVFAYEVDTATMATPTLRRLSEVPGSSVGGNGASGGVKDISPDARYVVWQSAADNLQSFPSPCALLPTQYIAAVGKNGKTRRKRMINIYLRDRGTDLSTDSDDCIEWISFGLSATICVQPNGPSFGPTVSANGCLVAFESDSRNMLEGGMIPFGSARQVYLHDRTLQRNVLVSHTPVGGLADSKCSRATVSLDGKWVSFESRATNLVLGDTNGKEDIFVYEVAGGAVTRVSLDGAGGELTGIASIGAEISGNGRFLAYTRTEVSAPNVYELWIVDRDPDDDGVFSGTPATQKVSTDSGGTLADGWSGGWPFTLTCDGQFTFFMSIASDLATATDANATCTGCGGNATFDCDEGRDIYVQQLYTPPPAPR